MNKSEHKKWEGGCLCQSIKVAFHRKSRWCAHCHCSLCQRAHGAALVTWIGVSEKNFELTDPEELLVWYTSTPGAQRGFCRRCGTTLLFRSERWPDEMHIVRTAFAGEIDRQPTRHVYYQSHAGWFEFDDELDKRP